jgi:hypothetical protein
MGFQKYRIACVKVAAIDINWRP